MTTGTVQDPVCGMPIDPKVAVEKVEFKGQIYYFCSAGCRSAFEANPGQYASEGAADDTTDAVVHDPVCGMPIDPKTATQKVEYLGRTYYFCSAGCRQTFEADPQGSAIPQDPSDALTVASPHEAHVGQPSRGAPAERPMQHTQESKPAKAYFDRDVIGLPEAVPTAVLQPGDGETIDLRATPIRKVIGESTVKMLGYNASVPGATLRVEQGTEVSVRFHNELDLQTTVHWHGLRHENVFDGVPGTHHGGVQRPIRPGEDFTYQLRFPDAGIYWYHPHIREDYAQEQGLYGSIIVTPADPSYWAPANREASLMLDDILIEDGQIAPFTRAGSDRTAMGRFGNVMLVNGETEFAMDVRLNEVVRLYLTNTANTRVFNVRIPGARLKLVGGDNGRVERETFVDEVLIAPSERAVVDVLFERPGHLTIEHRTPEQTYVLGSIKVSPTPVERSYATEFDALRTSEELHAERAALGRDLERAPDKTLALVGVMPGMKHHGGSEDTGEEQQEDIEWEDTMEPMNRMSTPHNMLWKMVDGETGAENNAISWAFRVGERVKIRIVNDAASDHPMQHPFHIHGERFLVLSRDGETNRNLVWKDTVLVPAGETVDILMDASNPGVWMAHCHIAEHLEGGMMFSFRVDQ